MKILKIKIVDISKNEKYNNLNYYSGKWSHDLKTQTNMYVWRR
jgi:hypothetical protein